MSTQLTKSERKARLHEIKAELADLKSSGARIVCAYGIRFDEVQREELWRDDGCESFSDWVENVAGYSIDTARKAILVSEHFNEEIAGRFGLDKLALGLRYASLTDREEKPGDILGMAIKVRNERGKFESVKFGKATIRQLKAAIAQVQAPVSQEPDVDDATVARLAALDTALPEAPKGTVHGKRIRLVTGTDGRVAMNLQGLPIDQLDAVLKALRAHLGAK